MDSEDQQKEFEYLIEYDQYLKDLSKIRIRNKEKIIMLVRSKKK